MRCLNEQKGVFKREDGGISGEGQSGEKPPWAAFSVFPIGMSLQAPPFSFPSTIPLPKLTRIELEIT